MQERAGGPKEDEQAPATTERLLFAGGADDHQELQVPAVSNPGSAATARADGVDLPAVVQPLSGGAEGCLGERAPQREPVRAASQGQGVSESE